MNQLSTQATPQFIDSREVAEMVGKEHSNLMKDIRRYIEQSAEVKIDLGDFFQDSTYKDANNQERPCYLVTRKGCEFIANKLTGVKGTEFTAKYINRFHSMEDVIRNGLLDGISPELQAILMQDKKLQIVETKVEQVEKDFRDFKLDMPLLGVELDRVSSAVKRKGVSCLGGKDKPAYHDKSLRAKVYADIYREIKRQFGVSSYKAIKRSQCGMAIEVVEAYELPIVLQSEVDCLNWQMALA